LTAIRNASYERKYFQWSTPAPLLDAPLEFWIYDFGFSIGDLATMHWNLVT
jgi:hypothetical protein